MRSRGAENADAQIESTDVIIEVMEHNMLQANSERGKNALVKVRVGYSNSNTNVNGKKS